MKNILKMSEQERKLYIRETATNRVMNKLKQQIKMREELKRI